MTDKQRLRMADGKLTVERKTLKQQIASALRQLAHKVEMAQADLGKGSGLDSHLIVNAAGLDGMIARWNLVLDLSPYVKPED